ncbi:glycosyltransferase [Parapedobacter sp. ISTM3]|uniref:glycosyltransferase family 2 protein n=1 Tax=Parapedobacter sp. ISTM3 TaxID=2800130 RepID=UPI0019039553|nr:glycosyltransferase [Parapedobacter sp. ISTM3]MBK1441560.1 glycosyltransferase [Parapedobacter sp. ISTM3]
METKISVVIPTYKRPRLLVRCLEALALQTLDKTMFEVVIVSDGPDRATGEAIARWYATQPAVNLRYLSTPAKKGPAAARNAGWMAAKHTLIAFTDDDCVPAPGWLQAFRCHYHGEPHVAMTGRVQVPLSPRPTDFEWNTAQLQTAEFITANCCCSKAALLSVDGFDEAFGMAWREDSELQFKLITQGIPIVRIDEACVWHPVRPAPWGVSLREQKKGLYNALLYKKHPRLFREKIQRRPLWHYYITVLLFAAMCAALVFDWRPWFQLALAGWLFCVALFTWKRLRRTRKSISHIAEMAVTSMLIPFASVYWQWYGAIKYRVLLL